MNWCYIHDAEKIADSHTRKFPADSLSRKAEVQKTLRPESCSLFDLDGAKTIRQLDARGN